MTRTLRSGELMLVFILRTWVLINWLHSVRVASGEWQPYFQVFAKLDRLYCLLSRAQRAQPSLSPFRNLLTTTPVWQTRERLHSEIIPDRDRVGVCLRFATQPQRRSGVGLPITSCRQRVCKAYPFVAADPCLVHLCMISMCVGDSGDITL